MEKALVFALRPELGANTNKGIKTTLRRIAEGIAKANGGYYGPEGGNTLNALRESLEKTGWGWDEMDHGTYIQIGTEYEGEYRVYATIKKIQIL